MKVTSRIPGFYKMSVEERKDKLNDLFDLTVEDQAILFGNNSLPEGIADKMIENVIGTFSLPLGLGLIFLIDGKDYIIPKAIEVTSIVASENYIDKIVRETRGFKTEDTERIMIGQIQVIKCPDCGMEKEKDLQEKEMLIRAAND